MPLAYSEVRLIGVGGPARCLPRYDGSRRGVGRMIGGRVVRWVVLVALTGCAAQPVKLGPDSDPKVARELLADAARAGPVRLEVNGLPSTADTPTTAAHLGEQAARGIRGLNVHFDPTPAATGSARLVLVFDPPANLRPRAVCAASAPPLPQESVASGTPAGDLLRRRHFHRRFHGHRRRRHVGRHRPHRLACRWHPVPRRLSAKLRHSLVLRSVAAGLGGETGAG